MARTKSAKKKPSICLVMIVKDESKVIKRCIDSVKDHIDYWVICDTGSTDGTQQIIKDLMGEYKIEGELHEREWKDYGTNRTESLELSKGKCDYRLIIDADDFLEVNEGAKPFENLVEDSYKILIKLGSISYFRTQFIKSDQDWKYIGVLHEYLEGPKEEQLTEGFIEGSLMIASVSGDKREGSNGKNKYHNDALTFEKELAKSGDELNNDLRSRYQFYLGQSYRDAEMFDRSIEAYQKRADMGGWVEEVYISLYMIAKIKNAMNKPEEEIVNAYLKAWEYRPVRLEAAYNLIRYLVSKKRYFLGLTIAGMCMRMHPCEDILFVESDIWSWKMSDEYSVLAYYTGNIKEAYYSCRGIVEAPVFNQITGEEKERILKNYEIFENVFTDMEEKRMSKEAAPEEIGQ
jgi:glycosyltransferase involved in cell wall biosynthesis